MEKNYFCITNLHVIKISKRFFIKIFLLVILMFSGVPQSVYSQSTNFVGSRTNCQERIFTSNGINVALPPGNVDDLLIASLVGDNSSGNFITFSAPAGWTLLKTGQSGDDNTTLAVFYKIATNSEPSSYNFRTNLNLVGACASIVRYDDVNINTNPVLVSAIASSTGTSVFDTTQPVSPSVNVMNIGTVVRILAVDNDFSLTKPSGETERVNENGFFATVAVADSYRATTGNSGSAQWSYGSRGGGWVSVTLAFASGPIIDPCDAAASGNPDVDGDGISDTCDKDNDNDGILDSAEGCEIISSAGFTLNSSLSVTGDVDTPGRLVYKDASGNQVILEAAGEDGNNNSLGSGPNDGTIITNTTTGAISFEVGSSDINDQPKLKITAVSASGIPFNISSIGFGNIGNMDNAQAHDIIGANVAGTWTNLTSGTNTLAVAQLVPSNSTATPVSGVTQAKLNSFSLTNIINQGAVSEIIFNNGDNNIQFGYNATFNPTNPVSTFELIVDDADISTDGRNIVAELITKTLTISGSICRDTDGDGTSDYLDSDSDGDGCSDADEAYYGSVVNADADNNGFYGSGAPSVDAEGKVIGASYNTSNTFHINANINTCDDADMDGIPDFVDLDDDNDGILDTVEDNCANATAGSIDWDQDFSAIFTGERSNFQNDLPATSSAVDNTTLTVSFTDPTGGLENIEITNGFGFGQRVLQIRNANNTPGGVVTTFEFSNPVKDLTFSMQDIDSDTNIGNGFDDLVEINAYTLTGSVIQITASNYGGTLGNHIQFNGNNKFQGIVSQRNAVNGDTGGVLNLTFPEIVTKIEFTFSNLIAVPNNNQRIGIADLSFVEVCDVDADNDGIPNRLDLDSDGDGCPDAIEAAGNFQSSNLVNPGTDDSLGDSVETNASSPNYGVPIIAGNSTQQATTTAVLDDTNKDACLVDLSVLKTIDKPIKKVGDNILFTITLKNEGDSDASNVKVKDILPTGLVYDAATTIAPTNTTYTAATGIWDLSLLTIKKGETKVLKIGATVSTVGTIITNKTEIFSATETDKDSTSNSNN